MDTGYSQADLEEGLVGATFNHWDRTREHLGQLSIEDFSDAVCGSCWKIFSSVGSTEEYLNKLAEDKLIGRVTGFSDGDLARMPSLIPWTVQTIRRNSLKRRIRLGVQDVLARDGDVLTELSGLVDQERERNENTGTEQLPVRLYEATIADMMDTDLSNRLHTGLASIDRILCGLRPGNISILGAEPSTGKTALALNIAYNAVRTNRKVLFFSLEMSDVQLMERMVASSGKLSYDGINNKHLSQEQQKLFANIALNLVRDGNLYIFDTVYYLEQMMEQIVTLKPDLVIVDFLQFCRTGMPANNTADRLEYIVSEFKRVAKLPHCQCHIMLLSQPSRQSSQEKQSMFTLKGSSAIEQGGDVILLLDRPAVRDIKFPPERATVKVCKNKFGRIGIAELYFDGEHQRFRDPRPGDVYTREPSAGEVAERPW